MESTKIRIDVTDPSSLRLFGFYCIYDNWHNGNSKGIV